MNIDSTDTINRISSKSAFQVCIDGYAACGKSTLARGLAEKLGFIYIDSGAMYRGVTLYFLNKDLSFECPQPDSVIRNIEISFEYAPLGADKLFLNGVNVSSQLRSHEVNENVSKVAAMPNVRHWLVSLQKQYGLTQNVVMDGRDIGTVVFPESILKLFLTASLETRILRRMEDDKSRERNTDYNSIRRNLIQRDHIDSTREDSPLVQSDDAVLLDNTNLSIDEQLAMTYLLAKMRIDKNPV